MKTTGTIALNSITPGVVKDALTPVAQTTALRSAASVVISAMAAATAPLAFAIARDGSRIVKFTGGKLSGLFADMITGGACAINYGNLGDSTKSRALAVNGNPVFRSPITPGLGFSGLYGRIARALAGFDPVVSDDSQGEAVTGTPLGILNALSAVPGVDYVFIDQDDAQNAGMAPRIITAPIAALGPEIILEVGEDIIPLVNFIDGTYDAGLLAGTYVAALGAELIEIDLPEVIPTAPTGERLPFE